MKTWRTMLGLLLIALLSVSAMAEGDNVVVNLPTVDRSESYEVVSESIQQQEDVETLIRKLQRKLNMQRQEGA